MEKKILFLQCIIFCSTLAESEQKYVLKQVVILSRHNVRTPLAPDLVQLSPKPWPQWKEKVGYLTAKGALLEGYMGAFFSSWLYKEGLLPAGCPNEEEIFVYANVKQRTQLSAKAFVDKAFPGCTVPVHHNNGSKDPIFTPVIHNTTEIFIQIALEEMRERLKTLFLNSSYEELENILDYKESAMCRVDNKCDLTKDKNKVIDVIAGKKPNVAGPLKIGNSAVDSFVMEYYEGLPTSSIAWGKLSNAGQWKNLMHLSRGYHNVIFNTTIIAKDIADPLIKYIANIFLNETVSPKIVLLMGHDANMYTILKGMKFRPYNLDKQYEVTPVGGKIVFQRWFDVENEMDLLKINFVYQSSLQLRNGEELSEENPPQFALLELEECKINREGFCLWPDFVKSLNGLM